MSDEAAGAATGGDKVQIGLSEDSHARLRRLKDDGVFNDMLDAYRLGIALAIARSTMAPADTRFGTIYQVASVDPDGSFSNLIAGIYPDAADTPYRIAERLAEAGVAEIGRLHEGGQLRFGELYKDVLGEAASQQ